MATLIPIPDFENELGQLISTGPADPTTAVDMINSLKVLMQKVGNCLKVSVNATNALVSSQNEMVNWKTNATDKINELDNAVKQASQVSNYPRGKSIDDVIKNLKSLGSDKSEFYMWNVKLINALTRVQPNVRAYFRKMLSVLDSKGYNTMLSDWYDAYDELKCTFSMATFNEDLYYVLVEKTEGDAAVKVNGGDHGNGLQAYQTVYLWFAGTTGMALSKRSEWVMNPPIPKNSLELAMLIPKWMHEITQLSNYGEDYDLGVSYKMTALKIMMTKFKDHFVGMKEAAEAKSSVKKNQYDELLKRVTNFATEQRLDDNYAKSKSDPMDISSFSYDSSDQWAYDPSWENYWGYEDQSQDWNWSPVQFESPAQGTGESIPVPHSTPEEQLYLNAVGKGKSWGKGFRTKGGKSGFKGSPKGKGKFGFKSSGKGGYQGGKGTQCFKCGKFGHIQSQCWSKGKGKGVHSVDISEVQSQGKGGQPVFNGMCFLCGEYGHSQYYCPHAQGDSNVQAIQQGSPPTSPQPGMSLGGALGSVTRQQDNIHTESINQQQNDFNHDVNFNSRDDLINMLNDVSRSDEWTVKVNRSRSKKDMRPSRINSITKTTQPNSGSVCSIKHQEYVGNFEKVKVTMDSGAVDPVVPPDVGLAFQLEETFASKNGIDYKGPNDSPIKNYGQRRYAGFSDNWTQMSGAWQVAEVKKVWDQWTRRLTVGIQ